MEYKYDIQQQFDLIEKALKGCSESTEILNDLYRPLINRYAKWLSKATNTPRGDAYREVQSMMWESFSRVDQTKTTSSPVVYLKYCLWHAVGKAVRDSQKHQATGPLEELEEEDVPKEPSEGAEELYIKQQQMAAVRDIMNQFKGLDRLALEVAISGDSLAEAARKMDVSIWALKRRQNKVLERCKKRLFNIGIRGPWLN